MKPYYPEDDAKWKILGHGEKVSILILSGVDPTGEWISTLKTNHFSGKDLHTERADDVHGLAYFASTGGMDDIFIPLDKKQELVIDCILAKDVSTPSPGCRVKSNYKKGIMLNYSYSRNYLKDWKK